jgi:hypothetical protein
MVHVGLAVDALSPLIGMTLGGEGDRSGDKRGGGRTDRN